MNKNLIPSHNSIKTFTYLNSALLLLAFFQYSLTQYIITYYNFYHNFMLILFIFLFRNYVLLHFTTYNSNNKSNISNNISIIPKENYKYEFDINIIISTTIETSSYILITQNYLFKPHNLYTDILYFIPVSFLFEIIFDFFHYVGHRTLHHPLLYKHFHKKHHKFTHPTAVITFYQDPIDIIITNSIPVALTLFIVPKISYFQFNAIIIYKNYSEICGHLGKKCYPTSSFCQFIWLPKLLNIQLFGEDHDLHHSIHNCNYSKRFSLWDKIFGTFKSSF